MPYSLNINEGITLTRSPVVNASTFTYGLHNASRFITKTCRKFRLNNILAVAVHDFCTIKTDSLHANLNFTCCWCGHLHIDNFQTSGPPVRLKVTTLDIFSSRQLSAHLSNIVEDMPGLFTDNLRCYKRTKIADRELQY